ncbi:MAG: hypothetical protein ACXW4U_13640 [Anaerolineales bacterium]
MHHYASIAEQFAAYRQVIDLREFGNGNINDTYLVTTDIDSTEEKQFVLHWIRSSPD